MPIPVALSRRTGNDSRRPRYPQSQRTLSVKREGLKVVGVLSSVALSALIMPLFRCKSLVAVNEFWRSFTSKAHKRCSDTNVSLLMSQPSPQSVERSLVACLAPFQMMETAIVDLISIRTAAIRRSMCRRAVMGCARHSALLTSSSFSHTRFTVSWWRISTREMRWWELTH